jgi:predicted RecA/RadA family phage recombinase
MALSANIIRNFGWGNITQYPVLASATIYEGSAVGLSSGYARALAAGDIFLGFACGKVVETTAVNGAAVVRVFKMGIVDLTITSVAVTDVGKAVYASDDGTFTLTQGSNTYIGRVEKYVTTNTASVTFEGVIQGGPTNKIYGTFIFPITNSTIADADIVTEFTPGFAGRIEKFAYVCHTPNVDGAKESTLNLEIGTVDVTGGVLALTSAKLTPLGKVSEATAITAANVFSATDTISIEAASTTAFTAGTGALIVTYSQAIA